jgi:hypothetical protein
MPRDDSPLIVGDYWLDKRRDGRSPYWQIAPTQRPRGRDVYRSTKQRDVERAGEVLRAFEATQRSTAKEQPARAAELLPHLFNYLREHGPDVLRLDTIKSSFRAWIGFLMQDELATGATVADIDKNMVARFRRWRMGPHEWEIEWGNGKTYRHKSQGRLGQGGPAQHRGSCARPCTTPRPTTASPRPRSIGQQEPAAKNPRADVRHPRRLARSSAMRRRTWGFIGSCA